MNSRSRAAEVVWFAARLPAALLPVGILAAAAASTGSMFTTATLVAAALVGMMISAPAAGAAAERFGQRNILLLSAIVHVLMLVLMVTSIERLTRQDTITSNAVIYLLLLGFTLLAGLSVPATATFSRGRWGDPRAQHEGPPRAAQISVRAGLRREAGIDDLVLVAAPLLVGLLSFGFGPTAGLLCSAVLTAAAVPLCVGETLHASPAAVETARFPIGGAEHAQQLLLESRGLDAVDAQNQAAGVDPAAESTRATVSAILAAGALGVVLAGLWVMVLGSALVLARPSLFALALAMMAGSGILAARRSGGGFTVPLQLRRRRLHAVVLGGVTAVCLLLALLLPAGEPAFLVLSVGAVLAGAALGRLTVGVYAMVSQAAPTRWLGATMSGISGSMLLGLATGLTVAGIAADELGSAGGSLVGLAGALIALAVVLSVDVRSAPENPARQTCNRET